MSHQLPQEHPLTAHITIISPKINQYTYSTLHPIQIIPCRYSYTCTGTCSSSSTCACSASSSTCLFAFCHSFRSHLEKITSWSWNEILVIWYRRDNDGDKGWYKHWHWSHQYCSWRWETWNESIVVSHANDATPSKIVTVSPLQFKQSRYLDTNTPCIIQNQCLPITKSMVHKQIRVYPKRQ